MNEPSASPMTSVPGWSRPRWPAAVFLVLAAFAAFTPALSGAFIDWDEDPLLIKNPSYRGLGWPQLAWMFTTTRMGHYMPLTWITYGLDYVLWGMNPRGYHLTSLLLHAASAAVFYLIALRLLAAAVPSPWAPSASSPHPPHPHPPHPALSPGGGEELAAPLASGVTPWVRGAAFLAALLWAAHPLRVESVVWVTERRDVLCGLLYLLAVLAYLRHAEADSRGGRCRFYWVSLGCFALGLLSKGMAASLPAVLLVLDVYPLRRITDRPSARRAVLEKIPFLALAVAAAAVGLWAVARGSGMTPVSQVGWPARVAVSAYALAFYLWKTVAPVRLSPLYELPTPLLPATWPFMLSGAVVAAITVAAVALRRRWPALLAAWIAYVVTLLPVVGLLHNGYQIAADRYSYLPMLGWALLAGGALRAWAPRARAVAALGGIVVVVACALTWSQAAVWRDGERLWRHALSLDPGSGIAHANLGAALSQQGRAAEAISEFHEAIRLRPNYPDAYLFLGVLLAQQGDLAAAGGLFSRALELRPGFADAHNNLGVTLARVGRLREATEHFNQAARLQPESAEAHNNLGRALGEQGRLAEAEAQFREALRLRADFAEAQANLEQARRLQGK